jgi:hydrogenase nickel incorporation protein HypA/HybF
VSIVVAKCLLDLRINIVFSAKYARKCPLNNTGLPICPRGGRCGTVHELSICSSIADIARRRADGRAISVINVRVGQLRQIVPDTLVYCWSLISEDTTLAARIRCRSCERTADVGDLPSFACAACGGIDVEIVAGEEFLVTSLELADEGAGG